jgi:hypothetical protein
LMTKFETMILRTFPREKLFLREALRYSGDPTETATGGRSWVASRPHRLSSE